MHNQLLQAMRIAEYFIIDVTLAVFVSAVKLVQVDFCLENIKKQRFGGRAMVGRMFLVLL